MHWPSLIESLHYRIFPGKTFTYEQRKKVIPSNLRTLVEALGTWAFGNEDAFAFRKNGFDTLWHDIVVCKL